jgi:hypothetical protein
VIGYGIWLTRSHSRKAADMKMRGSRDAAEIVDAGEVRLEENLTPSHLRCSMGGCPAVWKTNDGELIIIGKIAPEALTNHLRDQIGPDEFAVKISAEYFQQLLK